MKSLVEQIFISCKTLESNFVNFMRSSLETANSDLINSKENFGHGCEVMSKYLDKRRWICIPKKDHSKFLFDEIICLENKLKLLDLVSPIAI